MLDKASCAQTLNSLFEAYFKEPVIAVETIPPSGSDRFYIRLKGAQHQAIGAYSAHLRENNTYLYFTAVFRKYNLPVPELYSQSADGSCYLIEDKGNTSLLDVLLKNGKTEELKKLYEKAVEDLVTFQWIAGKEIDYRLSYHNTAFDDKTILADLNYFKYYFADALKVDYDKASLQQEMERWSKDLGASQPKTFMYRDFQSRNIIVNDKDEIGYIDFQGGMLGLPQYDLAALLWQAKAQLPAEWKAHLEKYYITVLKTHKPAVATIDEIQFMRIYLEVVLLRILQTLGAYGLRGLVERKPHFISSIYPALKQLQYYMKEYAHLIKYPQINAVLQSITKPEFVEKFYQPQQNPDKPLAIKIYSFSYKKGLPKDTTGHGGGFVFDCRGVLNPGRFDAYKQLTGKDLPVQEFLETKTLMPQFLNNIFGMIDITVNDYLKRGFDFLSISFGCTGGQHRSVYAAEQMKKHLKNIYNIDAEILHMEQDTHQHGRR